jgi:hypothetical protein
VRTRTPGRRLAVTTKLKRFSDAYATLTVATYEPLILRWISLWGIGTIATDQALRSPRAALMNRSGLPTAIELSGARHRSSWPTTQELPKFATRAAPVDVDGNLIRTKNVKAVQIPGFPGAVTIGSQFFPRGVIRQVRGGIKTLAESLNTGASIGETIAHLRASMDTRMSSQNAVHAVPIAGNRNVGKLPNSFDLRAERSALLARMVAEVDKALVAGVEGTDLTLDLDAALGHGTYSFMPPRIQEALAPVGVANFYRQLFFHLEEGVGPLEQAFTIAPLETLEVLYETVKKQTHEEQMEQGSVTVSESAMEEKEVDEVSDKVSSMIQRDSSAAMTVSGGGGVAGVWHASGQAKADMTVSNSRGREETSRRLTELTTRASERITKSFSFRTRDTQEITSTNLTRRVIHNDSPDPVSYGLRRVLRKVRVKVQDMGPTLVWQIYVCDPGKALAQSKLVHFRTPSEIAQPDVPPGAPPKPSGGTDTGATSSEVAWDDEWDTHFVTLVVAPGAGRIVTAVSLDSVTDLEGGGKDDDAPAPRNDIHPWPLDATDTTGTVTCKLPIRRGDASSVSLTYSYSWTPTPDVLAAWEAQVEILRAAATEDLLQQKFEQEKALITEHRRIRHRPAADLRREERFEVLNRMISEVFSTGDDPSLPTPLEIEYFHRFFDIESMFTFNHPSWWRPRYASALNAMGREEYTITAESEPAPMGSSLGWVIQADGDTRRNEFINSPWLRACIPIRRGRERAALAWLAKHIEGERGYDPNRNPLKSVLEFMDARIQAEDVLGVDGPEYVSVDSGVEPQPDAAKPSGVYPIIHEFDVTVPTDGFVYERLEIDAGP